MTPRPRLLVLLLTVVVLVVALPACGEQLAGPAPRCEAGQRLAIVAQSVPDAAYVPCVASLKAGWSTRGLDVRRGRTRFSLVSDRSAGQPVLVTLAPSCDVSAATPARPRADGARTYLSLQSITPRYAGTLFDVFAGGCVSYRFNFARGPHITLMDEMQAGLALYSRRQLSLELHQQLGIELDP